MYSFILTSNIPLHRFWLPPPPALEERDRTEQLLTDALLEQLDDHRRGGGISGGGNNAGSNRTHRHGEVVGVSEEHFAGTYRGGFGCPHLCCTCCTCTCNFGERARERERRKGEREMERELRRCAGRRLFATSVLDVCVLHQGDPSR